MNFEDRSEAERRGFETGHEDCSWGIQRMRAKVKNFVAGVKDKAPRIALNNLGDAAGQAKDYVSDATRYARDYVGNTSMQGMLRDVSGWIKKYPLSAMAVGMTLGFLLSRRRN